MDGHRFATGLPPDLRSHFTQPSTDGLDCLLPGPFEDMQIAKNPMGEAMPRGGIYHGFLTFGAVDFNHDKLGALKPGI